MTVTKATISRLKDQATRKRNKKRLAAKGIRLDTILRNCATHFSLPEEDIKGGSRKEDFILARHLYCWLAIHHTGENLPVISAKINREQTAVIWALKAINSQIEAGNAETCQHLAALQNTL